LQNNKTTEGITFLLLSPGIGYRSMKTAAVRGAAVGFIVGLSTFFGLLDDKRQRTIIASDVLGDAIHFGWGALLCLLYAAIWLAPNRGTFKRRPAVVYWASFWAPYRLILFFAALLEEFEVDAGYCIFHLDVFVGFAILKFWVTYRVFVLETKFW
jgi:hypothetical protein